MLNDGIMRQMWAVVCGNVAWWSCVVAGEGGQSDVSWVTHCNSGTTLAHSNLFLVSVDTQQSVNHHRSDHNKQGLHHGESTHSNIPKL